MQPLVDPEMNSRLNRWRTCLHESAHCVIARALNSWDCEASASVCEDGRAGVAVFPWGLSAFAHAVATAAGEYAERLPFDAPARRYRPLLPPVETAAGVRERAVREAESNLAEQSHRRAMAAGTDPERVARFCISMHPGEPQEWVAAHTRVHDEARRAACEHRDEIRRCAVRLFHRGAVTLPGDFEHERFFSGVVAGE
jgi:hypothetical protein